MDAPADRPDAVERRLPDLAARRLGGTVVAASDAFFAPAERLLEPGRPEWRADAYTDHGKWMDGWETRRRRKPGNDWAVVRLGVPGIVRRVVVDTTHFDGNQPESASIEACALEEEPESWDEVAWTTLVERRAVAPDARNPYPVDDERPWTHVRLSIYPDGGVARLRVHGAGAWDPERAGEGPVDLAGIVHGGTVVACSDERFGTPLALLVPGHAEGMWDGWETRRRRGPGHDWVVVRLGARGRIERIEIDTRHFKGNAPESARLEIADLPDAARVARPGEEAPWREILPRTPLEPDAAHVFPPADSGAVATHARLSIHPDGGVARLRLIGRPVE